MDAKAPLLVADEGVTPQRAGTCPAQLFRLILRYRIYRAFPLDYKNQKKAENLYKKIILFEKTHALLEAYLTLKNRPDVFAISLLRESLRSFQQLLLKGTERHIISTEELAYCEAISTSLEEILTDRKKPDPKAVGEWEEPLQTMHGLQCYTPRFRPTDATVAFPNPIDITHSGIVPVDPKYLAMTLAKHLQLKTPIRDVTLANYSLIRHLPPPMDDYWESIPERDIDSIFHSLSELQSRFYQNMQDTFSENFHKGGHLHWMLLQQLTIHGIFLRLSERSLTLKMTNFRPPLLDLNSINPRFHFHHQEDTERWKTICAHLKNLQDRKINHKELGLWKQGTEFFDHFMAEHSSPNAEPRQQHLQYVDQFFTSDKIPGMRDSDYEDILQHPIDNENGILQGKLPSSYYYWELAFM